MDDASVSRFPMAAAMPTDVRDAIGTVTAKTGFTPNVFLAYAWRPEQFRAFFGYYDTLMRGDSGLSRKERELIAVAVSAANECLYCTIAHGAALRVLSKNAVIADQVTANHRHADLTPREKALVELAVKLTREPAKVDAADLEALKAHGLSDADVWDAGAVAAFFNLSNRMATMAGLRPNPQFYAMGRNGDGGR
jgi:uncharacterized peroxidase-related enzyme